MAGIAPPVTTPPSAESRKAINRAIAGKVFQTRFKAIGDEPAGGTPEEFAATIAKDSAKWGDVVKRAGIHFD